MAGTLETMDKHAAGGAADPGAERVSGLRGYAILGARRSGSSHLCALIASTGLLGYPDEYLHPERYEPGDSETAHAQLMAWSDMVEAATSANGVTAFKIFYGHLDRPKMGFFRDRIAELEFVLLDRTDRLGQAISLARALQTSSWSAHQLEQSDPRYDRQLIADCLKEIGNAMGGWEEFLQSLGRIPLRITYEELVQDPRGTVQAIASHIGVKCAELPPMRSGKRIQRDALNEEWREQFLKETAPLSVLARNSPTRAEITRRVNRMRRQMNRETKDTWLRS